MVNYCCAYGCKEKHVKGSRVTFHGFPKDAIRRRKWELAVRGKDFKASDFAKICSKHFTDDCFDRLKFGGTWLKSDATPTIFNFPEHMIKNPPKERTLVKIKKEPASSNHDSAAENNLDNGADNSLDNEGAKNNLGIKADNNLGNEASKNNLDNRASNSIDNEAAKNNIENRAGNNLSISATKFDKCKRMHYVGDFTDSDMESPTKAKKLLSIAQKQIAEYKKKILRLKGRNMLLRKRVASLTGLLKESKRKNLVPDTSSSGNQGPIISSVISISGNQGSVISSSGNQGPIISSVISSSANQEPII